MTNPQKENGYTPVSNELLEIVIGTPFIATHLKIILVCWRYSYGFSRKEATLSESFIAKATHLSKRHISQEIKILIDAKVINVVKESTHISSRVLSVNKHYEQWRCRTTVPQMNHSSTDEPQFYRGVEPQFHRVMNHSSTGGVEPQFHQDNQELKQPLKQNLKQESVFENALSDFKEFRKSVKAQMSERAIELLLKKLDRMANDDETKIEILNQSIMNGWKGIFPLKDINSNSNTSVDLLKKMYEEEMANEQSRNDKSLVDD